MKVKPVRYYGYLQGWKVWIKGVKYPRRRGYFYTCMLPEDASRRAVKVSKEVRND